MKKITGYEVHNSGGSVRTVYDRVGTLTQMIEIHPGQTVELHCPIKEDASLKVTPVYTEVPDVPMDINKDGKVDKKDASLAGKVLAKAKKRTKKKKKKRW